MERKAARQQAAPNSVESTLVTVARDHFAHRGYADASLNAIVEAAGLTKGAVYHYFSNKQDLFRAVYQAEQRKLIKAVVIAFHGESDVWEAFHAGTRAFVGQLLDEPVRRIVLMDAPVALGWHELRSSATPSGVVLIRDGLSRAAEAGILHGHNVDMLANLVYGAVCEAAHLVGNSDRPDEMIGPVLDELRSTLDALVGRERVEV